MAALAKLETREEYKSLTTTSHHRQTSNIAIRSLNRHGVIVFSIPHQEPDALIELLFAAEGQIPGARIGQSICGQIVNPC